MKFPLHVVAGVWHGLIRVADDAGKIVCLTNDLDDAAAIIKALDKDKDKAREKWLFARNTFGTVHEKA